MSFFDMIVQLPGSPWMMGKEAYRHYAAVTGVDNGDGKAKAPKEPPTLGDVEGFQANLSPETKAFLRDKRGLTEESLAKYRVGWCLKRQRNAFPVFDESGTLVNVRFHNSKKEPKTLNWSGYGSARLWGLERLAKAAPGTTILITEGEFDAMLAEQETGFITVSSTNGAKGFKPEWVRHFHGFHVVLLYDSDQAGREAVLSLLLPAFKPAVAAGQVLSVKVVWLYDKPDKAHKDFTDWIVKDGNTGDVLKQLILDTPPQTFLTQKDLLPVPIQLDSLVQVDRGSSGQRVTVSLQVFGENTVAYHAPTKVKVTHCIARANGKCTGRRGQEGACLGDIPVPMGAEIMLAGVRASQSQFLDHLRKWVCDKTGSVALLVENTDQTTVREAYAHQIFEPMEFKQEDQVDKQIYLIGGAQIGIGKYRATGYVHTSYKDHQPVLLVDTLVPQEEDYQNFNIDSALPHLEKLKTMDVDDIVDDLSNHVTRIYKRHNLHLGVLLTLCSPLWINFPGDGRIRGWLTAVMVGDTGTGKTFVSQGLFSFAKVGDRVSGLTASRTGITYGLEHDTTKGWRVKAGALLKMSRQALIVDESQDLPQQELKTMAEGLDTGMLKIDRIQHKSFESTTRTIFCCNPRDPKNFSEQKKMEDFRHGCLSLEGIFPDMMIRRLDFVMFAASNDIEDKSEIFNPPEDIDEQQVTTEDLRALIFFAWNLKEDQIVITPEVGKEIRKDSLRLSQVFGCDNPPIVYPEDFRKTLARLSVAYAVLDLSTNEDFTQVIVRPGHVHCAADFIEGMYQAENCRLHKHAERYRQAYGTADFGSLREQIDKKLDESVSVNFRKLMSQIYQAKERIRKSDLAEEYDVDKATIQRAMRFFVKNQLVKPDVHQGYFPGPRLFKLVSRLEKIDPEKYDFGKSYGDEE